MKKTIFLLLIFLAFCTIVSAQDDGFVKVGLYYGSTARQTVEITADGSSYTYSTSEIGDGVVITSEGPIGVNGTNYRGRILMTLNGAGLIQVVNEIDLDNYVASVAGKEMSPSFQIEALKAQAVCARTFAVRVNKHANDGFDVCTTTHCQVYGGIPTEAESTIRAAFETSGQLARYNGEPIETLYFATSGGYTEDPKYVWGNEVPYLKPVADPYESKEVKGASWTAEITPEKATELMNNGGYGIGNVTDIAVLEQNERGVVTKLKVTGDAGEKIFTNASCRSAFGLLGQAFTVTPPGGAAVAAYGGTLDSSNLTALTGNGAVQIMQDMLYLKGSTENTVSLSSGNGSGAYLFRGRGYGHLIGMSQNGANGMAAAGFNYIDILKHYYQGIEVW